MNGHDACLARYLPYKPFNWKQYQTAKEVELIKDDIMPTETHYYGDPIGF